MTEAERRELEALDAYWTRCTDDIPYETYRRWTDLQVKRRDSDGTATAAHCEDNAVPEDCQARAESIAQP